MRLGFYDDEDGGGEPVSAYVSKTFEGFYCLV